MFWCFDVLMLLKLWCFWSFDVLMFLKLWCFNAFEALMFWCFDALTCAQTTGHQDSQVVDAQTKQDKDLQDNDDEVSQVSQIDSNSAEDDRIKYKIQALMCLHAENGTSYKVRSYSWKLETVANIQMTLQCTWCCDVVFMFVHTEPNCHLWAHVDESKDYERQSPFDARQSHRALTWTGKHEACLCDNACCFKKVLQRTPLNLWSHSLYSLYCFALQHCIVKMRMFAEVLILAGKTTLATEATCVDFVKLWSCLVKYALFGY